MAADSIEVPDEVRAKWLSLVACLAVLLIVSGCFGCPDGPDKVDPRRTEHDEGSGLLSASTPSGGGLSVDPPDASKWWVSFGGFILCANDPESRIRLDGVRTRAENSVLDVQAWRRVLGPSIGNRDGADVPFFSRFGRPPEFAESYSDGKPGGRFTRDIAGGTVTQTCRAFNPNAEMSELVIAAMVGRSGGRITDVLVDYSVSGKKYTLHIRTSLILCGRAGVARAHCD